MGGRVIGERLMRVSGERAPSQTGAGGVEREFCDLVQ